MGWQRTPGGGGQDGESLLDGSAELARVRAVLALGGVPWDQLDDGVQQVRVKLLDARAAPGKDPIRNWAAWLTVVASRVACDWHRSRTHDAALRERLATRWADQPPPEAEDQRVLALAVAGELETMPVRQRQVLCLRYYADLPVHDIARLLEIPEGTVKSRLHSATAALKKCLQDKEVI
ncbi:RNA polymerase sigma factor [Streptomyces jumonjinensis]|uniref:Sigma-70 family RNA polymerase sigma factor n=1 Tax=Streptomyces jumonjinensis TaxID=1945 RepID=A0A646KSJ7_STRJU|nr:sigma-70 family RNA polymerase sigma factor [Streptomyces jumonjinensis]MQT05205.1 sigma-70 family RNA polymerase sigma factor [Streptomyces jumonjinensis]